MKSRFNKIQIATVGALIGVGLFNPMSVEVLEQYFKMVYMGVFLLSVAWVIGFVLYKTLKPEQVKLPKKSAKVSKAGKLIAT